MGRIGAGIANTQSLTRTSGPETAWSKATVSTPRNEALTEKAIQLGRSRNDARLAITSGKTSAWLGASAGLANIRSPRIMVGGQRAHRQSAPAQARPALAGMPAERTIPMRGPRMGGKAAAPAPKPTPQEGAPPPLLTPDQELALLLGDDHESIDPEQVLAKYEQPERLMREGEVRIGPGELGRATLKFRSTRLEDQ